MQIFTDPVEFQKEALLRKKRGEVIGFVPTMGYLHRGHTSLMDIAREKCDWLVVSIYVNPLQFSPDEDLEQYPRDPTGDKLKCEAAKVDAIFIPKEMYFPDHTTTVMVNKLTEGLCGASREGHFAGVTTVVTRLFGLAQPDIVVFGEKDFQQLAVIRRMVRDLAMPIQVISGPLIRDTDGVALSSRNRYLSPEERIKAQSIYRSLSTIKQKVQESTELLSTHELRKIARENLQIDELDYLEFVNSESLEPLREIKGPSRAIIAAWVGKTRLIDNMDITPNK